MRIMRCLLRPGEHHPLGIRIKRSGGRNSRNRARPGIRSCN
jgi:hypothetical protein